MSKAEDLIAVLILFALLTSEQQPSPSPRPRPPPPGVLGQAQPKARSFEGDAQAWAKSRYAILRTLLEAQLKDRVDLDADEIATSVVAAWAIETDWGADECNFNPGSVPATKGAFFTTIRYGEAVRLAAFATIDDGARAFARMLETTYRDAGIKLLADATAPDWYVALGAAGYYPSTVADPGKVYSDVRTRVAAAVS